MIQKRLQTSEAKTARLESMREHVRTLRSEGTSEPRAPELESMREHVQTLCSEETSEARLESKNGLCIVKRLWRNNTSYSSLNLSECSPHLMLASY